jgi:hypothetical protein
MRLLQYVLLVGACYIHSACGGFGTSEGSGIALADDEGPLRTEAAIQRLKLVEKAQSAAILRTTELEKLLTGSVVKDHVHAIQQALSDSNKELKMIGKILRPAGSKITDGHLRANLRADALSSGHNSLSSAELVIAEEQDISPVTNTEVIRLAVDADAVDMNGMNGKWIEASIDNDTLLSGQRYSRAELNGRSVDQVENACFDPAGSQRKRWSQLHGFAIEDWLTKLMNRGVVDVLLVGDSIMRQLFIALQNQIQLDARVHKSQFCIDLHTSGEGFDLHACAGTGKKTSIARSPLY